MRLGFPCDICICLAALPSPSPLLAVCERIIPTIDRVHVINDAKGNLTPSKAKALEILRASMSRPAVGVVGQRKKRQEGFDDELEEVGRSIV